MSTHTGHESVLVCGRAQRDDVFRGVVFDGLDSVFANSFVHTLHSVLKALNNRRHIFAVTLKNDFATIKQQQKRLQAEKGSCFTSCARRPSSSSFLACNSYDCIAPYVDIILHRGRF